MVEGPGSHLGVLAAEWALVLAFDPLQKTLAVEKVVAALKFLLFERVDTKLALLEVIVANNAGV